MKQTLKATAAVVGMLAAVALFSYALNMPINNKTAEAIAALTIAVTMALVPLLVGYIYKVIISIYQPKQQTKWKL